jgi:BASS family bile acid:Na+ symporter
MDLKQLVVLALQLSIVAMVFGFGLKAGSGDVLYLARRPALLAKSLFAMFVIMPIVAVMLVRLFDVDRAVEIALVALSVSPIPPLLPRKERKAGGLASYGLSLMATLAVLSIILVPVAVHLLGYVFGRSLGMAPGPIARVMVMMVLGPLAAGMAVRAMWPAVAARLRGPVMSLSAALLPLAIVPLLVVAMPAAWSLVGDGTVLVTVIFVLAGLAAGHLVGGPDPDHAAVLALSSASRHPVIALSVAAANFPEERFIGAILLYLVASALLVVPYIAWQKRRAVATALAA